MHSRWMLVFGFVGRLATRRRRAAASGAVVVTHDHDHDHDGRHDHVHPHPHPHSPDDAAHTDAAVTTATAHRHVHHHVGTLPADPFVSYGRLTAVAVGALHGIGAETPTQILLFLAAARAGGTAIGIALLLCFVVGLLASNTVVALTATFGFLRASRNFPLYATVSVLTAGFSLVVGVLLLTGHAPVLPTLTG